MKSNVEFSKQPFKKLSRKYTKFNKKDVLEITNRAEQSPVEKRKMSKASEIVSSEDTPKSSVLYAGTNKRNSVVFQLMEEECPPHSHVGARGARPSIFSIFSHVASRSHRPSIFSRLSDFSMVSLASYSTWNYKKIFLLLFGSFLIFFIFCVLLVAFLPQIAKVVK